MRAALSLFRIRFVNNIQYRAVTLGLILGRLLWALMEILAFITLYKSGGDFPMTLSQTVSYLWMQEALLTMFYVVFSDEEIYAAIETGSIAYELVRPMGLYSRWFCVAAANRLSLTLVSGLPALLIALLLPEPFRLALPLGFGQFLLFLLSMALGLLVVAAFAMLLYATLFYTLSHRGVRVIVTAVTTFLSGSVIPLPFFPAPLLKIVNLLPFASMQNMPLLIYSGNLSGLDALRGVGLQLFWLAALLALGNGYLRRALRRVVVQGG